MSKWYVDVVDNEENVFIGYSAMLRWGKISVNYQGYLGLGEKGRRPFSKVRLKSNPVPMWTDAALSWESRALKVEGKWQPTTPSIQQTLFQSPQGHAEWHCYAPCAQVMLKRNPKEAQRGLGYAEHLLFTFEPWHLPIDDLRWGRYTSDAHSLVWIEWRKASSPPRRWLFFDSREVPCSWIGDGAVVSTAGEVTLVMEASREIRSSYPLMELARKLLFHIPGFKRQIPKDFLGAKEQKWLSRGHLLCRGKVVDQGWVIHEWVQF